MEGVEKSKWWIAQSQHNYKENKFVYAKWQEILLLHKIRRDRACQCE